MIYLDNSATSFPKPKSVSNAVNSAINIYGANPGRSGHKLAMKSSKEIYTCRECVAEFFNAKSVENVVFTLNCTHAINIVVKGFLKSGDHVVISDLEHNSVVRPLQSLSKKDITYTTAKIYEEDNDKTINSFRSAINRNTKLVICIHSSNVWGVMSPIDRIGALCKEYRINFMVDASQTAGTEKIDVQNSNIDFLCTAGHKGLYGPMGTGLLITDKHQHLETIVEGGTGNSSILLEQPDFMPDKLESGTPNLVGIVGLHEGIKFINKISIDEIKKKDMQLITKLYDNLMNISKVELYTQRHKTEYHSPILSFNINDLESEIVAQYLNNNYNIALRAGLHCSPLAHKAYNTLEKGSIRVSPSYFNTMKDIEILSYGISKI